MDIPFLVQHATRIILRPPIIIAIVAGVYQRLLAPIHTQQHVRHITHAPVAGPCLVLHAIQHMMQHVLPITYV